MTDQSRTVAEMAAKLTDAQRRAMQMSVKTPSCWHLASGIAPPVVGALVKIGLVCPGPERLLNRAGVAMRNHLRAHLEQSS